ncbi:MAG: hypothetical protein LBB17_02485 [Puniceicoccales bacterium]|jgi:hypothetical protein|nr:hypothetical protein [Puniceicoccales bacterium]
MNKLFKTVCVCVAAAIGSTGCQSMGPKIIEHSHPQYNNAVVSVIDNQLLLNIVRLKYRENPFFLEVNGITESRNAGADSGLKSMEWFPHDVSSKTKVMPTFLMKNYQIPTISYRPVRGKEFIKYMMTPIPLNVTLGMSSSGWKLQRVFNTCVEKINDVENAPSASGPTPRNKPKYEKFYEMTDLLKKLEDANLIAIGIDPNNQQGLVMRIKQDTTSNADVIKFKQILGLDQNKNEFFFDSNFLKTGSNGLVVRTRSLMGVLFYLSHAVDVPLEDIENGVVQTTVMEDGSVFDWSQNASGTLLKVHCSKNKPRDAFVATYYRDHWFYIADNDLHSKSTFMFVSMLFNLQAGEASSADVAPTLTIPVGR